MMAKSATFTSWALGLSLSLTLAAGADEIKSSFVRIAPRVPGILYSPAAAGPRSRVAVVVMHDNADFLDHPATTNLARRGYTVVAANARYSPDPDDRNIDWDSALTDLGLVVRYAHGLAGIQKVILLGHSSGAPLAAAYQNIAENGVKVCQGPEKIVPCPPSLAGIERADGLILLDPIFGLGANVVASVDPSLEDNSLDMYAPANGFSPAGAHYSNDFRTRFLKAQAARNAALIDSALVRRKALAEGVSRFSDDEPFLVRGATRTPKLWRPDVALLSHTKGSYLLLRGAGGRDPRIIWSVRTPSGLTAAVPDRSDRESGTGAVARASSERPQPLLIGGSLDSTVKRFLTTFASRTTPDYNITEDTIEGIDWKSSYNSTPGNIDGVTVPLLVMGMTGHYWLVSAEIAYQHAASKDKSIAFVEGATHGFTPCQPCERTPGEFGDTMNRTFDYVAEWIAPRY
jgi:pimeloyl-ACP methyl ester carboxylesterase